MTRRTLPIILLALWACACAAVGGLMLDACRLANAEELHLDCRAQVYFSPDGRAAEALVAAIDAARREILVLGYSFTSQPIIEALGRARARGVDVRIVLDKGQDNERYAALRQGLPVVFDRRHAIAHNKVMILDRATVCTGSYNFTASAEDKNAENELIAHCPNLAALYLSDWQRHWRHSQAPGAGGRVQKTIGGGK